MRSFFKYVLATITGIIVSTVLLFFIVLGIIGVMINSVSSKDTATPSNAVLLIDLDHIVTEKTEPNPFEGLEIPGYGENRSIGLNDLLSRIKEAETDNN
ncbi:MAG: signal peptide peptidase SppA, partial [Sphingobacterium sp.]